jgi:predicted nucleic acid-binding Zn ribbon protein
MHSWFDSERLETRPHPAHCALCGALTTFFDVIEERFVCSQECDDELCEQTARGREP